MQFCNPIVLYLTLHLLSVLSLLALSLTLLLLLLSVPLLQLSLLCGLLLPLLASLQYLVPPLLILVVDILPFSFEAEDNEVLEAATLISLTKQVHRLEHLQW